jgi:hypothetical protein
MIAFLTYQRKKQDVMLLFIVAEHPVLKLALFNYISY